MTNDFSNVLLKELAGWEFKLQLTSAYWECEVHQHSKHGRHRVYHVAPGVVREEGALRCALTAINAASSKCKC